MGPWGEQTDRICVNGWNMNVHCAYKHMCVYSHMFDGCSLQPNSMHIWMIWAQHGQKHWSDTLHWWRKPKPSRKRKKKKQFQLRSKSFEARHLPTRKTWLVNTALNIPKPCVRMFTKRPKNPQAETRLRFPMREVAVADRLRIIFYGAQNLGGCLPSGKLTFKKWWFSIVMLVYQRVIPFLPILNIS